VSASDTTNYSIIETMGHSRAKIAQQVHFLASYDALANSVSLMLGGRPRFAKGGQLVVKATPTSGIFSTFGAYLDGSDDGTAGNNGVFVILTDGRAIIR
jgi:hypothetical protein